MKLNKKAFNKWRETMSENEAYIILMQKTGLGVSTLQKLFAGTYTHNLKPPMMKAFAEATGIPEEKLWREDK